MKGNVIVFAVAATASLGGLLMPACSSTGPSSTADGGGGDTGQHGDASQDTKASADTGGACTGLDAASMMIQFTPQCGTCVESSCCSQAQKCASDPACIKVIQCQLKCIATTGLGAVMCATDCVDDAGSAGAMTEAYGFDFCLHGSCSTECLGPTGGDGGTGSEGGDGAMGDAPAGEGGSEAGDAAAGG